MDSRKPSIIVRAHRGDVNACFAEPGETSVGEESGDEEGASEEEAGDSA